MQKTNKKLLTGLSMLFITGITHATNYIGLDYARFDDSGIEPTGIVLKAGKSWEHISAEGRIGFGSEDDSISSFSAEIDSVLGGYVKLHPKNNIATPYVIMGLSRVEASVSSGFISLSDTETDLSYGAGITLGNDKAGFNIEYLEYIEDLSALSIGFLAKF